MRAVPVLALVLLAASSEAQQAASLPTADFVLVDVDPLLAAPAAIRKARVLETWIGGERVYQAVPQRREAVR